MDSTSATPVNNQTVHVADDWNIMEGALLVVVTVVGIFVNLFIVAAILSSRRLRRRVTDVLCCHLALVGIIWCGLLLPVNATAAFAGGWPLRAGGSARGFCDVHGYAQATLVHVMVWTIATLGWNKYRTISIPLRRVTTVNRQRLAVVLLPAWAIGLTLACFPLISGSGTGCYGYGYAIVACVYEPSLTTDDGAPTVASIVYSVATTVFGFLLPVGITAYSYLRIYNIARWHRKRIAVMSAVVQVMTLSVGVPVSGVPEVPRQTGDKSPPAEDQPTQAAEDQPAEDQPADPAAAQRRERRTSRNALVFFVSENGVQEVPRQTRDKSPPAEDQPTQDQPTEAAEDQPADPAAAQRRERRTSRNALAFFVALVLCYAPHYTLVAVSPVVRRSTHSSSWSLQFPVPVEILTGLVTLASPAVNGFVYGVRNRAIIRSFRRFIRPQSFGDRLR